MNRRPHPYQGCALPTELPQHQTQTAIISLNSPDIFNLSPSFSVRTQMRNLVALIFFLKIGAGNGVRTRNIQLGRLALCQLSYPRKHLVSVLTWSYDTSKKKICQYLKEIFFKKYYIYYKIVKCRKLYFKNGK